MSHCRCVCVPPSFAVQETSEGVKKIMPFHSFVISSGNLPGCCHTNNGKEGKGKTEHKFTPSVTRKIKKFSCLHDLGVPLSYGAKGNKPNHTRTVSAEGVLSFAAMHFHEQRWKLNRSYLLRARKCWALPQWSLPPPPFHSRAAFLS